MKARSKVKPCWHCAGTNVCGCMFCIVPTVTGEGPGPCGFCAGRAEWDRVRPILDKHGIDPRERKHWEWRSNPRDQNRAKIVFLPIEQIKKGELK